MTNFLLKYWGFSEQLGPVIRRRFRATAKEAHEQAQRYANFREVPIDDWDEDDKSYQPGTPAVSLKTVSPTPVRPQEPSVELN